MVYTFLLDLTEDQKLARRHALDRSGSIAQASILLPLAALQVWFLFAWLGRWWRRRSNVDGPPSSPYLKGSRGGGDGTDWAMVARRWAWWAGEEVQNKGERVGSRGEVLVAAGWMGWLLVLCFVGTGNDYFHLTKRFGIVAASQLPIHYLLAVKSPYSPLAVLLRCSYESLNTAHQLLSRIIAILLYVHAALYVNIYIQNAVLIARLQQFYVLCGLFALVAYTVVGMTALAPVRRWSYRFFYVTHVVLASALLPVLWFHVSHIRIYLYETAAVYALSAVLRTLTTRTLTGTIRKIPDSSLIEVTIPRQGKMGEWQPGQHAYLSLPGHTLLRPFRSNPITVASVPDMDGRLSFVVKVLDGNTAKMSRSIQDGVERSVTIEGPYGVGTHPQRLLQCDRVLLVAGGVGGAFIIPLYRQLLADLSPSPGSYRRSKVRCLWSVRSLGDATWALPEDDKERKGFVERLTLHVSGGGGSGAGEEDNDVVGDDASGIELEQRKKLLSDDADESALTAAAGMKFELGRPDVSRVVAETFSQGKQERVAVVVCGPTGFSANLRKEVGRYAGKGRGREVWFWDESFAL